jgi:two-component system, cell cycle sensor histidine kinase and response regulator CckA
MKTERQEKSQEIAKADSSLKIIMAGSPMGIIVFDRKARVVYVNPLAAQLFGKSAAAVSGITCGEFIDCTKRQEEFQECGSTESCSNCTLFSAICKVFSGESNKALQEGETCLERDLELTPIWLKYKVSGLMVEGSQVAIMIFDDITGYKQDEEKLRSALAELSVIHEHAPVAMMLVGKDRRIRKINGFAARFAGRLAPEMEGLRGGEALCCLHHLDDPQGCGFGPACADCPVRNAVMDTFESEISRQDVKSWLPLIRGGSIVKRCLLISTAYLKIDTTERVLVCIQDITDGMRAEKALRKSELNYRILIENTHDIIYTVNNCGTFIFVSPSWTTLLGHDVSEVEGKDFRHFVHPNDIGKCEKLLKKVIENQEPQSDVEYRVIHVDGGYRWHSSNGSALFDEQQKLMTFIGISRDITDRKRVEEALLESEQRYREIFNATSEAIIIDDAHTGQILDVNESMIRMYGYDSKEEVLAGNIGDLRANQHPYTEEEAQKITRAAVAGKKQQFEWLARKRNGELFPVEVTLRRSLISGKENVLAVVRDITGRKLEEKEREKLQSQFVQAQKMESIGRLAGGVAHDYNNMLVVIMGYAELAMEKISPKDPFYSYFEEILTAAKRSTEITRQLLAFARKQTIRPKTLDLNETVESMLKMLRRLIGEDIDLAWLPETQLWPVKMDTVQLDQILANLCVNARDAIAGTGKVTIETENRIFDEDYCADHAEVLPGEFALLAISDNGHGMEKETLSRIFEPFFTTKSMGQGTGLGLATVYGIVKQNKGFINVYSEPGEGTTFKIYLPRHAGETREVKDERTETIPPGHEETVLVVEDEPAIMKMSKMMLEQLNYRVLAASTPGEAMRFAEEHSGLIHLLITDVVMPEMNGRDLADQLHTLYPGIKILFMSGYTASVIAHHGVLNKGVHFIQKPFSKREIAIKIKKVLEESENHAF